MGSQTVWGECWETCGGLPWGFFLSYLSTLGKLSAPLFYTDLECRAQAVPSRAVNLGSDVWVWTLGFKAWKDLGRAMHALERRMIK